MISYAILLTYSRGTMLALFFVLLIMASMRYFKSWQISNSPTLAPGGTGALSMQLTPTKLGPLILFVQSSTGKGLEAVSEVRLWVVPKAGA